MNKINKCVLDVNAALMDLYECVNDFAEDNSSENLEDVKTAAEILDNKFTHMKNTLQFKLGEIVGVEDDEVPAEPTENGNLL